MTRRRWMAAACAVALTGVAASQVARPTPQVFARSYDRVMGTSMEIKVVATGAPAADRAAATVLAEIDRESALLSGYDATSEFSRWLSTRNEPMHVSPELFEVLSRFDQWRERTGGALDPAAETISRVWKAAAQAQRLPEPAALSRAVARVQQPQLHLDYAEQTATHLGDADVVLNSFTKSYIVDRAAAAALAIPGVTAIVVNAGGDLVTRGTWHETVAITDPQASADNAAPLMRVRVADRAVATSGVYRRGVDIRGVHYSHIVDPRTGQPAGHVLSSTVIAPNASDAGALATAFSVLTPDESERLATTVPGAEFLLVLADGRRIESAGWRALTVAPSRPALHVPSPIATLGAAEQTFPANMEATVAFDIAPQQFRAQRPYLAVWVEDKDRFPVRTLAVWYSATHAKWLADLKAWYRGDRLRNLAEGSEIVDSVSSATRGPGQYTLTWDGKDNSGKTVKAGIYTIYLEIAREHGTYQIVHQDLDTAGGPKKFTLPGNVELTAASIDYHRVAGK